MFLHITTDCPNSRTPYRLCTMSLSGSALSPAGSFIIAGAGGGGCSLTGLSPSGTIASPYCEDVGITGAMFIELGGAGL